MIFFHLTLNRGVIFYVRIL